MGVYCYSRSLNFNRRYALSLVQGVIGWGFCLFILKSKRNRLMKNQKIFSRLLFGGILVALHWVTFFYAIKISNVSTALVTMSVQVPFLLCLIEPFFERKRFEFYELILASITITRIYIIFRSETVYNGIIYALISSFLVALFSVIMVY